MWECQLCTYRFATKCYTVLRFTPWKISTSIWRPSFWTSNFRVTCDQAFFFFAAEGGRKKKESLIQLLVESSAAPQLKCLSTRVSAMPSDKSEPITIYRKSLRWRESAEARSGHEVCKQLYVAFCFPTNQKKVQILDFLQTTRQVIVSGVHFSVDYTAARKITPDRRLFISRYVTLGHIDHWQYRYWSVSTLTVPTYTYLWCEVATNGSEFGS